MQEIGFASWDMPDSVQALHKEEDLAEAPIVESGHLGDSQQQGSAV